MAIPDPSVIQRYPFELSGGLQQRVVIAMAFAGNPKLLVLDEPTTGLDATVEAEVLDLFGQLRRRIDEAILLIGHNLGLVARLCDRVGVLYAGKIVEEGRPVGSFQDPRHPYTGGLLRCSPASGCARRKSTLRPIPGIASRAGHAHARLCGTPTVASSSGMCARDGEPDLYSWPSRLAQEGGGERAVAAAAADPTAASPHDAETWGEGERHTRGSPSARHLFWR